MEYKVLILEDDPTRMVEFRKRASELKEEGVSFEIDHTDKAAEAIEMIEEKQYDLFLLDHDLGGEVYVDIAHTNTGSEVARFINGSDLEFKQTQCIIHSMNIPAARHMKALIETKISETHCIAGVWFPEVFFRVFSFA